MLLPLQKALLLLQIFCVETEITNSVQGIIFVFSLNDMFFSLLDAVLNVKPFHILIDK